MGVAASNLYQIYKDNTDEEPPESESSQEDDGYGAEGSTSLAFSSPLAFLSLPRPFSHTLYKDMLNSIIIYLFLGEPVSDEVFQTLFYPKVELPKSTSGYTTSFQLHQTRELLEFFHKFGFVIIDDILTKDEVPHS